MARKSKGAERSAGRGRHLRPVPAMPPPPRELVVAGQVLDSFTPDFVRWFEQSYGEPEPATDFLTAVTALLAASFEFTGTCSATVFPPTTVSVLLEETDRWGDDEAVQGLTGCLLVYLDFLHETGRWSGTAEEFRQTHGLVAARVEGEESGGVPIEAPELGEDEEAAAFAELPIVRRVTALLTWLGTGKEATSTGALRLKDVAAAAETVGVRVHAQWNAKRLLQPLPGFEAPGPDATTEDGIPVVRSMHEVPVLSTIWPVLSATGLITLGSTRARPSSAAQRWLHGTAAERAAVQREFVARYLGAVVAEPATGAPFLWPALEEQITSTLAAILLAGCTEHPVPCDRLDPAGKDERELQDVLGVILVERVRARLDQLVEQGLLTADTHYRVPPVVVQCVLAASGGSGEPAATAVEPATYQLKIALRAAKPPIWRRVLVPSTMRLDELHAVIQQVFAWEDSHLHFFSTGDGYRGTRYGPVAPSGPLGAFDDDDSIDESTVPLGALLTHAGDSLVYLYDFGDDWFHDITLEKIGELDSAQELPRCTGGRGAAPAEDSGGVWGWAGVVDAVNDPAHPEHEELRDWLGLRPGERIDPKAFDVAAADAALGVLR